MRANARTAKFDWTATTWEGSRLRQLRRWSKMSLSQILDALEEMAELAKKLGPPRGRRARKRHTTEAQRHRDG